MPGKTMPGKRMTANTRRSKRGLATLELVLTLPLLVLLMALLINAGTSAAWRLRAQGVAREAVWRNLWPRGATKPDPANWPKTASFAVDNEYDELMLDVEELQQEVIRGPLPNVDVDFELLDPSNHGRIGRASIRRERPILPKIGPMAHAVEHRLFDRTWTYPQTGLPSNGARRIKPLYDMHESEFNEYFAFQAAVADVQKALVVTNLRPLGPPTMSDPDFAVFVVAPGVHRNQPDSHPRLQSFGNEDPASALDPEWVRENRLRNPSGLIDRIIDNDNQTSDASVPRDVAGVYRSLYRDAIAWARQQVQNLLDQQPSASQQAITAARENLAALEAELLPKIEELTAFIDQF